VARNVNGADYGAFFGRIADRISTPGGILRATYPIDPQRSVVLFEDFLEDTINVDKWTLTKDANATNYVATAGAGGTIAGTAGNTDGEGLGIYGFNDWYGDKNCGMEVRIKFNQITNGSFEIGFADTATDFKDPIVTDVDVVTAANGAGDFALIKRDTAQTLTTSALVTLGSTPYTVTKSNLGTFAPTAATYFVARVQLIGDTVIGAIFDANGGLTTSTSIVAVAAGAGGIEGGTALRPFVNVTRTATADVISTIDYIRVWQDR
jgi:hypothetical protein